jgi:hypothetical protein
MVGGKMEGTRLILERRYPIPLTTSVGLHTSRSAIENYAKGSVLVGGWEGRKEW